MPFRDRLAAGLLMLMAGTGSAAAAPCENSLLTSKPFLDAIVAVGVEYDQQLAPIEKPTEELDFPDVAENAGFEGKVYVLLLIAPDGAVADRVILCAEPYGYFEAGVLDWAKGFKFAPVPTGTPDHYRAYMVKTSFRFL